MGLLSNFLKKIKETAKSPYATPYGAYKEFKKEKILKFPIIEKKIPFKPIKEKIAKKEEYKLGAMPPDLTKQRREPLRELSYLIFPAWTTEAKAEQIKETKKKLGISEKKASALILGKNFKEKIDTLASLKEKQVKELFKIQATGEMAKGLDILSMLPMGMLGETKPVVKPITRVGVNKIQEIIKTPKTPGFKFQRIIKGFREGIKKARAEVIDRFAPIGRMIRQAEKITGKKIMPEADPYKAARLFQGYEGKVEAKLENLGEIIKPVKKRQKELSEYLMAQRMAERARRGIVNPRNITENEALEAIENVRRKLGDASFRQLEETAEKVYQYSDDILKETREAGIISDDVYHAIKAKNQKYVPFDVLEYIGENIENLPRGRKAFNVASQDIVQAMKGTVKDVADPLEAMVGRTYKSLNLIERNKVAQKFVDLRKVSPEMKKFIVPLEELAGKAIPKGYDIMSVFKNGIKEEYAVIKDVAEAMKGLNAKQMGVVDKLARTQSGMLRAGATALNIEFFISNLLRDFQTAMVTYPKGFFFVHNWLDGFFTTLLRKPSYKLWKKSGGAFSTWLKMNQKKQILQDVTASERGRIFKTITNPKKLIEELGSLFEEATRVGAFKKARRQGLGLEESGFISRDVTIDFSKSGNTMRILNMWIPFLNARMQGTINIAKAIKTRPFKSAAIIGGSVALPAIVTYMHNLQKFPDLYKKIPQWEKDMNFPIILGRGKDSEGNEIPIGFKIPKGDAGKVFGNAIEYALNFLFDQKKEAFDELALKVASDILPVSVETPGKFISSFMPPVIKAGIETTTNFSFFRDRARVPRSLEKVSKPLQYKIWTSPTAIALGKVFNMSPINIEENLGTMFGGLGRHLLLVSDTALGKVGIVGERELTKEDKQRMIPIMRRFWGIRTEEESESDWELTQEISQKSKDESVIIKREATEMYNRLKKLPKEEANRQARKIKEDNPKLFNKIKEIKKEETLGITSLDKFIKSLSVSDGSRVEFIITKLNEISNKSDKNEFIKQMRKKKIITDTIMKQLRKAKEEGRLKPPADTEDKEEEARRLIEEILE